MVWSRVNIEQEGKFHPDCMIVSFHSHCRFHKSMPVLVLVYRCRIHHRDTLHLHGDSGTHHSYGNHNAQHPQYWWHNLHSLQHKYRCSYSHSHHQRSYLHIDRWHQCRSKQYTSRVQSKCFPALHKGYTGTTTQTSLRHKYKHLTTPGVRLPDIVQRKHHVHYI